MSWSFDNLDKSDIGELKELFKKLGQEQGAANNLSKFLIDHNIAPPGAINCKSCNASFLFMNVKPFLDGLEENST